MDQNVFSPARILLPRGGFEKWSVVACDQYTSQPEYWEETARITADAPSALRLILPELYLGRQDTAGRVARIHAEMDKVLRDGVLDTFDNAMVYVERTQSDGTVRRGLVGALDLLAYDFRPGSRSPVRATEGTVLSRIPPRLQVREGAKLELPHILVLIDDPDFSVIEPLAGQALPLLYDFNLMQGGGHIRGRLVGEEQFPQIQSALRGLRGADGGLWFAVGDGNHSLATAKTAYENLRGGMTEDEWLAHPARYALVELCNLRDSAISFEPIHRIVFGVHPEELLGFLRSAGEGSGSPQQAGYVTASERGTLTFAHPTSNLAVGTLQNLLDAYLAEHPGAEVDYIHGEDAVESLARRPDAVGFLLPPIGKEELFPTVEKDGVLPRKTFSMGHAQDKRYYLEAREIL